MLNLLHGWELRQHLLDGRLVDGLVALALIPARPVVGLAREVFRPADACRFLSS